ncbi:tyrosine-type recombinase/integrase [Nonomuraea wenchangensis]
MHPQHVSDQFLRLAYLAGLPPIRLHDLRHGTASLMLAAGVEMKVAQETLGHTSSAFTADTYTSVYRRWPPPRPRRPQPCCSARMIRTRPGTSSR